MSKVMTIGDAVVTADPFGGKWRGTVDEVFSYGEADDGRKRFHAEAANDSSTPSGQYRICGVEYYVEDYEWDAVNNVWFLKKEGDPILN